MKGETFKNHLHLSMISMQVYKTIEAQGRPMKYKEVSDYLVEANYLAVLSKAGHRGNPSTSSNAKNHVKKGKNGTLNLDGELEDWQFKAIETFRRRIYDSWMVLKAAKVIQKIDQSSKLY